MRNPLIPALVTVSLLLSACGKTPANPDAAGLNSSIDPSKIESHLEKQSYEQIIAKAEGGDAGAQFELGTMYQTGDGVGQDLEQAMVWYKKAAMQKNRQANFNIAMMYKNGTGVEQDYPVARRYFNAAEELGEVRSSYQLGMMYYTGEGVAQDFAEAKKHFEKAAMGQLAEAQVNLGVMYIRSEGIEEQDPAESYAWFLIAAENQSVKGADLAEKLKEQITEDVIAKAMIRKEALQKEIKALDKNTR